MNNVLIGLTTYNKYCFTYLCLKYLEKNTPRLKDGTARLILLDNNSTDGTLENIKRDFPWVKDFIVPDRDCIPYQLNLFINQLKENEDFVMVPQDVCVGPNWLELLQEDTYKNENTIMGSPYFNCDLAYDDIINTDWANEYFKKYNYIRTISDPAELESQLNSLYMGDYESFVLDFQERNKNEPPLDNAVSHIWLFKNKLFTKDRYRFNDIDFPRYYGAWEFDIKCTLNNMGYYNIASSRAYVHHWISISNQESNINLSEKQKIIRRNNLKLFQIWEVKPEEVYFMDGPRPKNIPNWKTPYYKFKKREVELSEEEAAKQPGTAFMVFCGLKPGENYFNQILVGSVLTDGKRNSLVTAIIDNRDVQRKHFWDNSSILVAGLKNRTLVLDLGDNEGPYDYELSEQEFIEDDWSVIHYWRKEEEKLNEYWCKKHSSKHGGMCYN